MNNCGLFSTEPTDGKRGIRDAGKYSIFEEELKPKGFVVVLICLSCYSKIP